METRFVLVSDSSCDLPPELAASQGVRVVPFYVSFDGKSYSREGVEIGVRDFYQKMVSDPAARPRSSMPSVEDYRTVFEPLARAGQPVLCLCITTKFSGSMQSALNAAELVRDDVPGAEIEVLDATVNTVLQGLLVMQAAALRDRGVDLAAAIRRLVAIRETGRIFFTIGDIAYLRAGGRIGKVAGIAGTLLGVKPVITLRQGEIFPSGLGRSRDKNIRRTIELVEEYYRELGPRAARRYELVIGYGYDRTEAERYREQLLSALQTDLGEDYWPADRPKPALWQIGAAIGVHTGPYPLGAAVLEQA